MNDNKQAALESLKEFSEQMKTMAESGPPPLLKQFLEAVYSLKEDEEALGVLKEEIVKNYGE